LRDHDQLPNVAVLALKQRLSAIPILLVLWLFLAIKVISLRCGLVWSA